MPVKIPVPYLKESDLESAVSDLLRRYAKWKCADAGIERTFNNSASYIKNWLERLKDDPSMVVKAASQAQKAVDLIRGKANETEAEAE